MSNRIRLLFSSLFFLVTISSLYCAGSKEFRPAAGNANALELSAPIVSWDEAIPLGNGMTGILLWGEGNQLKLSLDRGDLWDNRLVDEYKDADWNYKNILELIQTKDYNELNKRYDTPYGAHPYPTKLPGGRLEILLNHSLEISRFQVDYATGIGKAFLTDGSCIDVIFCQNMPAAIVVLPSIPDSTGFLVPGQKRQEEGSMSYAGFQELGYPEARLVDQNGMKGFVQNSLGEFSYMMATSSFVLDGKQCIAIAMTTADQAENSDDSLMSESQAIFKEIQQKGLEFYRAESIDWWTEFNSQSSVNIADSGVLRHYNFVKYLYGAGARKGAPPMPLQGVWTADTAGLPPWKGDFHFDLNVQMNYWGCYTAGLKDSAAGLTDFMTSLLPIHKKFAKDFYGADNGIAVPGVMTLDGKPMGGWAQYSLSPAQGVWLSQHYYWEWKYNNDDQFLVNDAYPYCKGIAETMLSLLKKDDRGFLMLPASTSPEIFNNDPRSWLKPNSNYDQALMIWLFKSLSEMSKSAAPAEEQRWIEVLAQLEPLCIDADNSLMFNRDHDLFESHRHHSHLMSIYPLQLLDPSADDLPIIISSLDKLKKVGSAYWVGYSFSWAACMEAIAGRADNALDYLELFDYAYVSKNGFHVNGDQQKTRTSQFTYKPFTLEGNFAAMQAVHLMLIQNRGDLVSLFPAVPQTWLSPSFKRLRVYGGTAISANYMNQKVVSLRLESQKGGDLVLNTENLSAELLAEVTRLGDVSQWGSGEAVVIIKMDAGFDWSF